MTVEERLEALEKELQQIKDVQAIKELKSKYFQALDTKNWDELETTMAPNVLLLRLCLYIDLTVPGGRSKEREK